MKDYVKAAVGVWLDLDLKAVHQHQAASHTQPGYSDLEDVEAVGGILSAAGDSDAELTKEDAEAIRKILAKYPQFQEECDCQDWRIDKGD